LDGLHETHTVGHAMPTTIVGYCWLKILSFAFTDCISFLMVKRSLSFPPTMFLMGLTAVVMAS